VAAVLLPMPYVNAVFIACRRGYLTGYRRSVVLRWPGLALAVSHWQPEEGTMDVVRSVMLFAEIVLAAVVLSVLCIAVA